MTDKALTPQQLRFIDEYLIDLNGKQAAIRAGYSEKTAEQQASRLLSNVKVSAEIEQRQKKVAKKVEISQEWVLKQLKRVYKRSMKLVKIYDKEGNYTGDLKFEPSSANKSLELLGRHLKMFTDKVEHSGSLKISHEEALKELK